MISFKQFGNKSGFTLIELLSAVFIIGIIATLSIISLGVARTKARDTMRINDISQLRAALELYFKDHGVYPPTSAVVTNSPLKDSLGVKVYISRVPDNPQPLTGSACTSPSDYQYTQKLGGASYALVYCLENGSGDISSGISTSTPLSLKDLSSFVCSPACATGLVCVDGKCTYPECPASVCGDCRSTACGNSCTTNVYREGASVSETYGTMIVGTQCWLTKNINIGTMDALHVMAASDPYSFVSRYCYSDSLTNCNDLTYGGGLYNWAMAMYLPASFNQTEFKDYSGVDISAKRQGICPAGWHIPSDYELAVMENYLDLNVSLPYRPKFCGSSTQSFYADNICGDVASSTGWRGSSGDWVSGIGPKLYCLGTGTPVAGCIFGSDGFNLPLSGYRDASSFLSQGSSANIWTSTQASPTNAWRRIYSSGVTQGDRNINIKSAMAYSVRCIRD